MSNVWVIIPRELVGVNSGTDGVRLEMLNVCAAGGFGGWKAGGGEAVFSSETDEFEVIKEEFAVGWRGYTFLSMIRCSKFWGKNVEGMPPDTTECEFGELHDPKSTT